jgi:hypothetical protein
MKLPLALAGLGATALGLALVIALEMLPSAPIVPVGPTASTADGKPAASPHRAEIDRDDLVEALLARPPFSPLRRPEKVARPADEAHGPANELPRLAGIMISGGQRRAIFQAVGDDKPIVVEEGGELTGWHIDKIVAAAVTLNGPEGSRTIEPVFDPNAKPAEPAMPARVGQPNPPGVPANGRLRPACRSPAWRSRSSRSARPAPSRPDRP